MSTQELGDYIKSAYEDRTRFYLPRRAYTIIRIDGKNFSRYTRGLNKPFDIGLANDFDATARGLCAEIMGCRLAYTQSDEITLVLTDFDTPTSDAWFDGNLQKIVSVSASMATRLFNRTRIARATEDSPAKEAHFDARVFSIADRADVIKCLAWRQADAVRNSISMVARSILSHKEMDGVGVAALRTILKDRGVDLASIPLGLLQGRLISKETYLVPALSNSGDEPGTTERTRWVAKPAPQFSSAEIPHTLLPVRS